MNLPDPAPKSLRGRPTDPGIEARISKAAIEVYANSGWAGFTYDAIAVRSGVGKAAIYRRWSTKLEILSSAWQTESSGSLEIPDTGSLRGDLLAFALLLSERLAHPLGVAELRMPIDVMTFGDEFPDIGELLTANRAREVSVAERAIERGELDGDADVHLMIDMIRGTLVQRFVLYPRGRSDNWVHDSARLVTDIVDVAIVGSKQRKRPANG